MLAAHGIMDYSLLLGIENRLVVCDDVGNEIVGTGRRQSVRNAVQREE